LAKWLKIKDGLNHLKSACKTKGFDRVNTNYGMFMNMSESYKKKKTQISLGYCQQG